MGQYVVTGPNGKKYKVNAPEGATEEEIISYAQSQLAPTEAPVEEDENFGSLSRLSDAATRANVSAVLSGKEASRILAAGLEQTALAQGLHNIGEFVDDTFLTNSDGDPNLVGRLANSAREWAMAKDGYPRPLVGGPPVPQRERVQAILDRPLDAMGLAAGKALDEYENKGFAPMRVSDVDSIGDVPAYVAENLASSLPQMGVTAASGALAPIVSGFGLMGGQIVEEIPEDTNLTVKQQAALIATAGPLMAAFEMVGLGAITRGFTPKSFVASAVAKNLEGILARRGLVPSAARVIQAGVIEGSTELVQEVIAMSSGRLAGRKYTREQVRERLIESLAAGGAVGSSLRAGGEVVSASGAALRRDESQTELDAELAVEEAELAVEGAEAAERAAELVAKDAEQARRLRQAAVGFKTEGEFIKARTAQLNEQSALEVDDPGTPLGQEFEAILNGENETGQPIYSTDQVEKARSAFLKKVAKERIDTGALKAEYEAALNDRAAQLEAQAAADNDQLSLGPDNPNAPDPEARQAELPFGGEPQVATETDGPLKQEVTLPGSITLDGKVYGPETPEYQKYYPVVPGGTGVKVKPEGEKRAANRAFAEEHLGKNWEIKHPDIQMRFVNSTGFYKTRVTDGRSGFEHQVLEAAAEAAAEAEAAAAAAGVEPEAAAGVEPEAEAAVGVEPEAEAAAGVEPEAEAAAAAGVEPEAAAGVEPEAEAAAGVAPEAEAAAAAGVEPEAAAGVEPEAEAAVGVEPEAEPEVEVEAETKQFKPKNKVEKAAVTLAERELGPDWREAYPQLVNMLAAKKYSLFDREVYAAAESAGAKTPAARNVDAMSRLVANSEKFRDTLSPNEQKVFDRLLEALRDNETDAVLNVDGGTNATEFAKQAGVKSKSGVSMGMKRIGPKIAKFLGITPEELQAGLQAGKTVSVESAVETDAPVSVFDTRDLEGAEKLTGAGFQTVGSVGSSASEGGSKRKTSAQRKAEIASFKKNGMTDEQIDAFYAVDDMPQADPVAEARASAIAEHTKKVHLTQLAAAENDLRADWDNFRSKDGPQFDDLSQADKIDWMLSVNEYHVTQNLEQLDQDQRSLEQLTIAKEVEDGNATGSTKPTENITRETAEGSRTISQDSVAAPPREDGSGGKADREGATVSSSVRTAGTGADVEVNTKTKAEPTTKEQKATVEGSEAETKPSGDVLTREQNRSKKRFSIIPAEGGPKTTVDRLATVADRLYGVGNIGTALGRNSGLALLGVNEAHSPIQVHATAKDAYRALGKTVPLSDLKSSQAVIDPRNNAAAHFIAENIEVGSEAAVMAHEMGVHLGMEKHFSDPETIAVAETLDHWASMPEGSLERTIHERATNRLAVARALGLHPSLETIEKIGYAAEEAVLAGVKPAKPDANGKATVGQWLQSALDIFDRLVNTVFKGAKASITPVELVTMVQGMALGASRKLNLEPVAVLPNSSKNNDSVIDYYGQREKGVKVESDARLHKAEAGSEGRELFYWGDNSTFGERKGISSSAAFDDNGDMVFALTDRDNNIIQTVYFAAPGVPPDIRQSASQRHANSWQNTVSLIIYGPEALEGKPVGFKLGDMEVVDSVSGYPYVRLNGVKAWEALRMLREARRRFTRHHKGFVPHVFFERDTGAAFNNNAKDGKLTNALDRVVRARYSKKPVPPKGEVSVRQRKGREWVKRNMGSASAKAFDALAGAATKPADNLLFLYDLVEKMEGKIPAIRTAYNAMKKMEATRNEIQLDYEQVANRAGQLAPERYALMNDFLSKSTFYQKWGYDPRETHPELFEGRKIKISPVMKNAWERLNKDEQSIVADIFAQGEKNRVRMMNLMKSLGLGGKLFTSTSSLEGPYSPLKRFGNYAAVLKSKELRDLESKLAKSQGSNTLPKKIDELKSKPDHYVVEFFDTQGAANEFAEKNNTRDGGKFFHTQAFARDHKFDNSHAPSTGVLEKLLGGLNADDKSGLDQNSKEAFRLLIREQYFSMMDERDARTSGAKRLNRAGYDKDMVRSFLYHGTAVSQMIATMEEGANVHEALAGVDKEASTDRGNLQHAFKLISEHYAETLSPEGGIWNAIQNRVATANTIMMLTSNPGYHGQNATQTLISINKFVGDFGVHQYPRAWIELFKAYRVANRAIKGGGLVRQAATVLAAGALDFKNNVEIDNTDASMPAEYQPLIRELELHGIADVGIQEDLRQFNRFDTGFGPLNAGSDFVAGLVHRNFQAARYVEAHNRLATAIAAYELAKRNPKQLKKLGKTPTSYAVLAVQRTQGAFNALDAPLMFKKLPKLPVQYRKYQVMMGWNYARAMEMVYRGESAAMKAVGYRTLGVTLFHAALVSGLRGLPLVGGIATTALMMFGDDDDDIADEAKAHGGYDNYLEHYIREKVEDERVADLITRGVPAFFGFDMSDKLGHQNFFSVQPYTEFEMTQEGMAKWLTDVFLGPTSSTLGQGIKVFDEFVNNGDYWRSLEQALPKGQRQMMESWRLSTEGMTFKNREAMVDPRDFDLRSLLANALGLPATQINKIKWNRSQQYEIKEYFKERTGKMQNEYHRAYRAGDRDKMSELRAEWREVQKAKTRLRSFFNGDPTALRRAPVSDLVRIPRSRSKRARKDRRRLGTN